MLPLLALRVPSSLNQVTVAKKPWCTLLTPPPPNGPPSAAVGESPHGRNQTRLLLAKDHQWLSTNLGITCKLPTMIYKDVWRDSLEGCEINVWVRTSTEKQTNTKNSIQQK